jgi:transcriptional regulator with XRE-family HTH domain
MHHPGFGNPREIIETLRIERGFTSVRALAAAAGVNQPSLSRYLSGKADTLELETFAALAQVLEVTVSELIGEVPLNRDGRLRAMLNILKDLPEPDQDALMAAGQAMVATRAQRGQRGH